MKKTILASCIAMIIAGSAMAQPVSDRAVIPLGVTLVQILRIHVTNGGNIEFVFNDIEDYKNGITNAQGNGFYDSDVQIASSTEWQLDMGAEDANLIGTDDPTNATHIMALDNVGFTCDWGTIAANNTCCSAILDVDRTGAYTDNISALGVPNIPNGLLQYAGVGTVILFTSGTGNGGDVADNNFTINWECGTTPAVSANSPMSAINLLDQNIPPDRYVTNVFLELTSL
ncbi:MAG: hypothetical protein HY841_05955 [Bacteroidetes bacterium]|nr:hypothetical protein [Bacteroidota bacterium]